MAISCSVPDLMGISQCFDCLHDRQLRLVTTSLLCQILLDRNPMASCDVQSLLSSANCFSCLSEHQLATIQAQLLCEILNAGGSGEGCILCGDVDPVDVPDCSCALAYNRTNGSFWYWDGTLAQWVLLIGG